MPKKKYEPILDGEPFELKLDKRHEFVCCDCGLTHSWILRAASKANRIMLEMWRENKETMKNRKRNNYGIEK